MQRQDLGNIDLSKANSATKQFIYDYFVRAGKAVNGSQVRAGVYTSTLHSFTLLQNIEFTGSLGADSNTTAPTAVLQALSQECYANKLLLSGPQFILKPDNNNETPSDTLSFYAVTLLSNIVIRKTAYHQKFVIEIHADSGDAGKIGNGSFGMVKHYPGVWKLGHFAQSNWGFKSNVKRVSKNSHSQFNSRFASSTTKFVPSITKEARMMREAPHLGARGPFFSDKDVNGVQHSVITMHYFKGIDLFNLLAAQDYLRKQNIAGLNKIESRFRFRLSVVEKFELSIQLMRQLAIQIHSQGLVHRDIKPENIMIDRVKGCWVIKYIDLNFAIEETDQDYQICGTACYIPPEIFQAFHKHAGTASDIYPLGITLAMLWGDTAFAKLLEIPNDQDVLMKRKQQGWIIPFELTDEERLDDALKIRIMSILNGMTLYKPGSRFKLEQACNLLQGIHLNYLLQNIPIDQHAIFSHAYECANNLCQKFQNPETSLEEIRKTMISCIESLTDHPVIIKQFCARLHEICLANIVSKAELLQAIRTIFRRYSEAKEAFFSFGGDLQLKLEASSDPEKTIHEYDMKDFLAFEEKMQSNQFSLDEICAYTHHFNSKIDKLRSSCKLRG